MTGLRRFGAVFGMAAALSFAGGAAHADSKQVLQLDVKGVVDPFVADYVTGGIRSAIDAHDLAVLITIDTSGGYDSSIRKITDAVLASPIPVITYVPSGGTAAAGGTYVLLSGSVAAAAPGTHIGPAQPVGLSGATDSGAAVDEAAAEIGAIAHARGRNAAWAESAVRDQASITAEQAVKMQPPVIDLVADDVPSLLSAVNGTTVPVAKGGTVTLATTGATVTTEHPGLFASLLHGLLSPDLAFIFFYLGIGLIVLEFIHPGIGLAAVFGILSLAAAFVGFGALPVQILGVVLLIGSVISFLLELKAPGIGVFTAVGVILLVAGALTLYDPSVPSAHVSWIVIVPVAVVVAGFFGLVLASLMAARRLPVKMRTRALIGRVGVVTTPLTPTGVVHVASESWSAVSTSGPVPAGTRVMIVDVDGLRLKVSPSTSAEGLPAMPDGEVPVSERAKQLEHLTPSNRADSRPT